MWVGFDGKYFIRLTYHGQGVRAGNLIEVNQFCDSDSILVGSELLKLIGERSDFSRFELQAFDVTLEGWLPVTEQSKFKFAPEHPRLDVRLQDRALFWTSRAKDIDQYGFFGIGIYRAKTAPNHGTLWRTAYQLGASFVFGIGPRHSFDKQTETAADTAKAWTKMPFFKYPTIENLLETCPYNAPLVAIEGGGIPLSNFSHPPRAVYILGSEDNGLPEHVINACTYHVSLPAVRSCSYNVAVAGALLMYDRLIKFGDGTTVPKSHASKTSANTINNNNTTTTTTAESSGESPTHTELLVQCLEKMYAKLDPNVNPGRERDDVLQFLVEPEQ